MHDVIQFALLGLGAGAVYTLLSQGIVVIYRASGVVNFAQAAFAMVGAYSYYELRNNNYNVAVGLTLATLLAAVFGLIVYLIVIRPLRDASPVARLIATLGVLTAVQAGATMRYHDVLISVPSVLPDKVVHIGNVVIPRDRLWLLLIGALMTTALYVLFRFTQFGRATSAVSENETAAASLGWSPDLIGAVNWTLGAGLAGVAGVLIVPLAGLTVTILGLLIVPTLAAAVLGGFTSFPLTFAGSILIGVLQSEAGRYINAPGWPVAIPFLVVVVYLVVRGRALPLRSHLTSRLPRLGAGTFRPIPVLVTTLIVAGLIFVVPEQWAIDGSTTFTAAIIVLSIVVLTGNAGQLTLAQYAFAGVAALTAGRLVSAGWAFEPAALVAVLLTVVVGGILGLPALRVRGVNLAILTLGLGSAVQAVLFQSSKYTGSSSGTSVGPQTLFGISIDAILKPRSYAIFALLILVICGWITCNIRSGASGRKLLAVRTNERAAASLGLNITGIKLYAFAVSAGLAGIAGVIIAFSGYVVTYDQFSPTNSIFVVSLAVIGGIGYVTGAPIGAVLAAGGIGTIVGNAIFGGNNTELLLLIGGLGVIVVLIQDANGLARNFSEAFSRFKRSRAAHRVADRLGRRTSSTSPRANRSAATGRGLPSPVKVRPQVLEVSGLTLRYGGVTALNEVNLRVSPGEVVGLIGPNGAGKTSFIDTVTGFAKPAAGTITLDGDRIERRPAHQRVRSGLSRSFQSLELFDDVPVIDNIRAATDTRSIWTYLIDLVKPTNAALPSIAWAAISEFGLEDVLDTSPEALPYGTRRLVAIARAVSSGPSILLLDEPAAGLDESETAELATLIRRLADVWGIGVLVIEHDMQFVMGICDRVAVLEFGHNIATGTPSEIRRDPLVIAAYLGEPSGHDGVQQSALAGRGE